jgi:UDP-glucuronate 4-epimerase
MISDEKQMKILVTGAAGFIGMHVAQRLLAQGVQVVGVDNLNDYYDVRLKENRLKQLAPFRNFRFVKLEMADRVAMEELFRAGRFQRVVNLGAQAGVRYSIRNPHAYINSNIVGFLHVLEGCRHNGVEHLVYASSSSVYGTNTRMPFSVRDNVDHPISLYAATKKSNELMAHSYSHVYGLPTTGLRFFTVYGPWGRPDMAMSLFTKAIIEDKPIEVFNHGKMQRDFTYIDDIVEGVVRVLGRIPERSPSFDQPAFPKAAGTDAPYRLYNIGNDTPVELMKFIETIENAVGKKAVINMLPMQAGDVSATHADIADLHQAVGFTPHTPLKEGVEKFVGWFKAYYGVAAGQEGVSKVAAS